MWLFRDNNYIQCLDTVAWVAGRACGM